MGTVDVDVKLTRRQAENHRASIKVGVILERLQAAATGAIDLTPTQTKAAQILLDKALPTLQSIDQTNHTETPELTVEEIDAQLSAYISDLRARDPARLKALTEPTLRLVANDL
jgi:hypothetical protein